MERQQKDLPFAEADGSRADRRNLLGLAMLQLGVDAAEARFMEWLFNITDGGARGELKKCYEELASRPWGMCCSPGKARNVIRRLKSRGVISVHEHIYQHDGQSANSYRIDWDGVRALLGITRPGVTGEQGGVTGGQRSVTTEQGSVTTRHPNKGNTLSYHSSWPAGRKEEVSPKAEPRNQTTETTLAHGWSPTDRSDVLTALRNAGYDAQVATRLAHESETELGLAAEAVLAICAEFSHPTNRQRFQKAGAIGYRLRHGSWPVNGVVPLHAAQSQQAKQDQKRMARESETVLREMIKACQREKVPDEEIRRRLREKLPESFCVAAGW